MPIAVEVEACLLSRPAKFFRREPTKDVVARLVNQREHVSPASLISNTLELARSHPLLLLHVREAEERKASLVRKHQHQHSKWKRARHDKTRADNDDREPDEPTDGGSRSEVVTEPAGDECVI